jgi:hypothetical protein
MSFDQAREFLAKVLPWPQDGDAPAWTNLHWTFVPKDLQEGRKAPWTGRAVQTVAEAARALEFATKLPSSRDVYVCLSTQRESQVAISAKGHKWHKPVRLAENAIALKSLFLDLDAKGSDKNSYDTPKDAIAALAKFLRDTGMPKPSIVVGSGGGFHVYWTLARALSVTEWYPLANALVQATIQHGLKCDTAVTTDAARVLRVPDTFNHKTVPPRPVRIVGKPTDFDYSVEKIDQILAPYKVDGAMPSHLVGFAPHLPRLAPIKGESDLAGGVETAMPQLEVRACLDAIPNTVSDWNAWNTVGMRVFAACEGADYGLDEWRRWSDQLPTQGTDSCEARWETLKTSPPTRTGAGALVNAAREALGDPHWQARALPPAPVAATPAGTAPPAPPSNSDLPPGYSRDTLGIVSLVGLNDVGATTMQPISRYPLLGAPDEAWIQVGDERLLHFWTVTERGSKQRIRLPLEIVNTNEMRKVLQAQGFMLGTNPKLAMEFFVAWIQKLQESKDAVISQPFGWHMDGGKIAGFIYGGKLFTPSGDKPAASADPVLARQYGPTGELDPWTEAAALVTSQGRPDLDAILASAFAAPLVQITGEEGLFLSAWSQESGIGKTTTLKVAQAVWGDPVRALQGLDDTGNSVMGKIGQLRSLPCYWDELKTEEETRDFVKVLFRMTSGREKSRMTARITQRDPGRWQTLMVSASNDSILNFIVNRTNTTTAGLYRVFEYEVTPGVNGQIDSSVATKMIAKLNHNYGQAGLIYSEFLANNAARIDMEVADFLSAIGKEANFAKEERFWRTLIGTICMGAKYANELGLTSIDEEALKRFMYRALAEMRGQRHSQTMDMKKSENVSDRFARFLNDSRARHTIFTNRVHISRGRPTPGSIKIMRPTEKLDSIHVHIGLEDKIMRISSGALHQWLADQDYSRPIFVKALEKEFGMKRVNGRMASGTDLSGASEYLFEIDLGASQLINFIDEA